MAGDARSAVVIVTPGSFRERYRSWLAKSEGGIVKARKLLLEDLVWVVDRLTQRRASLVPYAPVYWRPAADAARIHRRYLGYLLSEGGAVGIRTDDAFLIAAPGRDDRWTIDDAVVPDGQWAGSGQLLWDALSRRCPPRAPKRSASAARWSSRTSHTATPYLPMRCIAPTAIATATFSGELSDDWLARSNDRPLSGRTCLSA
jgi:hypothetical protein